MNQPTKRFERKWTDEQIRACRFDYEGMTHQQVSTITGIPLDTVKAYRRGLRRRTSTGKRQPPKERWRHMRQEELRLFFLHKATLLLGLYQRMQEKLDETGNYVEPQAAELAVRQTFAPRRELPPATVVERAPVAEQLPDPLGRPPVLPETGRSRPRLSGTQGILFTRR